MWVSFFKWSGFVWFCFVSLRCEYVNYDDDEDRNYLKKGLSSYVSYLGEKFSWKLNFCVLVSIL